MFMKMVSFSSISVICIIIVTLQLSYTYLLPSSRLRISNTRVELSPVAIVIRKNKLKEIAELKQNVTNEGDSHVINQYLNKGVRPVGISGPLDVRKYLVNRYKTVSVIGEFNKRAKTGFILGMPPPEIVGGVLRDAGAKGIVVSLEKKSGGASVEDFYRFCKEQYSARKFTPGSIPIIWNDNILDPIQVQLAAAYGASSVVIDPDILTTSDELKALISLTRDHSMEPIIFVKSFEDAQQAIEAGGKMICMRHLTEAGFISLREQLPNDPSFVYIAKLRAEASFSIYTEIDVSWVLRDHGFNCVWPSPEGVYVTGLEDVYSNIVAVKAKASRQFISPRQFLMDRKKEGAKEFLGNIYF